MPLIPRDGKPSVKDVVLTLLLAGGMLFWLYALLLFEGLATGRLEIRPLDRTATAPLRVRARGR